MLSVSKCRGLLGDDYPLTDEELRSVRDALYGIAKVALDAEFSQMDRRSDADPGGGFG